MAEKVYCIVKKRGYYYVPVKAEYYSYEAISHQRSYLACLPNFFGGAAKRGECDCMALNREILEESQGKISLLIRETDQLSEGEFSLLSEFKIIVSSNRTDNYRFYLVTMPDNGEDYFEETTLVLDRTVREAEKKEMSCILKIPVADVAGCTLEGFLRYCKDLGGEWVKIGSDNDTALKEWWEHKGTKDAFQKLLEL